MGAEESQASPKQGVPINPLTSVSRFPPTSKLLWTALEACHGFKVSGSQKQILAAISIHWGLLS